MFDNFIGSSDALYLPITLTEGVTTVMSVSLPIWMLFLHDPVRSFPLCYHARKFISSARQIYLSPLVQTVTNIQLLRW